MLLFGYLTHSRQLKIQQSRISCKIATNLHRRIVDALLCVLRNFHMALLLLHIGLVVLNAYFEGNLCSTLSTHHREKRERELRKEGREVPSRVRLREGPICVRITLGQPTIG